MRKFKHITVMGAGAWGTALAATFARNGHTVTLCGRDDDICRQINQDHTNNAYLEGIELPASLKATTNAGEALDQSDLVLWSVPAQATRAVAMQVGAFVPASIPLIACAKGIEKKSGRLQTEILQEFFPENTYAALSGPSFAADIAKGLPTAVVLAMSDISRAQDIASALSSKFLRMYISDDPRGVQFSGALKNVIAIAVGICRGGNYGSSAEAALIARGYSEMMRLGLVLGVKPETLMGLSGLGDLVLTCSSPLSRNFQYGIAIGRGEATANLKLAEGVSTIGMANALARAHKVSCPISEITQSILEGKTKHNKAFEKLMMRPVKHESR